MMKKNMDERVELKEEELEKATGGYIRKKETGKKSLVVEEEKDTAAQRWQDSHMPGKLV